MKRMGAVLVLLVVFMAVPARADDASKRAKVMEQFRVMHVDRMTEQITASVRKQMDLSMRSAGGANITADQKQLIDGYEGRVMAVVRDTLSWKVVEPQMIDLYASTYSEGEIDGILAFYRGPVGQSMLAKTPELTEKSMAITNAKLVSLQPKISEMSQEFSRQFAAAQNTPAKAGTGSQGPVGPAASPK